VSVVVHWHHEGPPEGPLAFFGTDAQHVRVSELDLREAWADLLTRRAAFAESLAVYGEIVERWAALTPSVTPLDPRGIDARALWERGVPLIAERPPSLSIERVEELLGPTMDLIASIRGEEAVALQRFAEAWDAGAVGPASLLPAKGRVGSVEPDVGLAPRTLAALASLALRPFLAEYFRAVRADLDDGVWSLGICPFCGAPPAFGDIVEDGRRRLGCHCCGGGWFFSRRQCAFCGTDVAQDLLRLDPDGRDEGYFISACTRCRAYVKELDRRVRWNAGSALVEDWGSPHLDLVAERQGYWRPLPTLLQLARS